jgi:hypothetical protein
VAVDTPCAAADCEELVAFQVKMPVGGSKSRSSLRWAWVRGSTFLVGEVHGDIGSFYGFQTAATDGMEFGSAIAVAQPHGVPLDVERHGLQSCLFTATPYF